MRALSALSALLLSIAGAAPNMVFIFLDDLDVEMGSSSAAYMPELHSHIAAAGASFSRSYVSVPVCCPSRSSLYTGQYQHNNRVLGNGIATNCSSAAWQAGPEKRTFPILLQAAGYRTFFAGKYLNDYGFPAVGGTAHVPPGWSDWHGLVGNSQYYNFTLSNNGASEPHGDTPADYLPTIVRKRSVAFMNASVAAGAPFFAYMSFPSCHGPQEAEAQYQHLYPEARAPRTPNYNASVPDAHWLQAVQGVYGLDDNAAAFADLVFRRRLQTLRSVDAAIADVVATLNALGVLNNTYIVFSADSERRVGGRRAMAAARVLCLRPPCAALPSPPPPLPRRLPHGHLWADLRQAAALGDRRAHPPVCARAGHRRGHQPERTRHDARPRRHLPRHGGPAAGRHL